MSEKDIPHLDLPNRWEKLQARANDLHLDVREFVERVDDASRHIDEKLSLVRSSGGGIFEIILGLSGSGKTTFVNTLPKFFEGVSTFSFPREEPLQNMRNFIKGKFIPIDNRQRIFLIERRDNPNSQDIESAREMFVDLLDFFRTAEGSCLLLWTMTDRDAAKSISDKAWDIGRDSLVDSINKGLYEFKGLEKKKYPDIANDTAKNLTGDGLEVFGVTQKISNELLADCETISDYYGKLTNHSRKIQGETWSILKEKVHPKLWILLPGDSREAINATVRALTQGTRSRIDVDLLREFIDDPQNAAQYIKEWKDRRGSLAHLFRALDVRLFSMPPNVSVAAVRCFGEPGLKRKLKIQAAQKSQSLDALRKTRIYKEILNGLDKDTEPFAERGSISDSTKDEYRRIQAQAENSDKPLNKALGELFKTALQQDLDRVDISVEKKSLNITGLQPDILIKTSDVDFICIEPTWRSSGTPITGETKNRQNTLAEGHIKQYVLGKTLDYVKAIGL